MPRNEPGTKPIKKNSAKKAENVKRFAGLTLCWLRQIGKEIERQRPLKNAGDTSKKSDYHCIAKVSLLGEQRQLASMAEWLKVNARLIAQSATPADHQVLHVW